MDETTRWVIGIIIAVLLAIAWFMVKRLYGEVDRHRDSIHELKNSNLRIDGKVSVLIELIRGWIKPPGS